MNDADGYSVMKYVGRIRLSKDLLEDLPPSRVMRRFLREMREGNPFRFAARQAFEAARAGGLA